MKLLPLSIIAAALVLAGCSNEASIRGKVISGDRSFIGVVDSTDPRLEGEGIEDAQVRIVSDSGPLAGTTIGSGTSDRRGEFAIAARQQQALIYPARFHADRQGYVDVRQTMPVPPSDRRILIILQPREAPAGAN